MRRIRLAVVINARDAFMGKRPAVPGLRTEPGQRLRVLRITGSQQLDGHRPGQHEIRSRPHHAEAPGRIRSSSRYRPASRTPVLTDDIGRRLPTRSAANRTSAASNCPIPSRTAA
jgi:hypothetical protein